MGNSLNQFRLLLWKNFLLQIRRPISTCFEILLPIFFVGILLVIRITSDTSNNHAPQRNWPPFEIGPMLPKEVNDRSSLGKNNLNWTIAYAPMDQLFNSIMNDSFRKFLNGVQVEGFETESDLLATMKLDMDKGIDVQQYLCGVVFVSDPASKEITYRLRFPPDSRSFYILMGNNELGSENTQPWFTEFVFPRTFQGIGPRANSSKFGGVPEYYEEGFTTVQRAVEFAIVDQVKGQSTDLPDVKDLYVQMQRFPYPDVVIDGFILAIQSSLPLLLMLSLVYTSLCIVKGIVVEKEKKLKESMKMMGLANWLHWAAWFVKCFVFLFIPMCIITIFLSVSFGKNGSMLNKSDGSVVFLFLLLYSIASIMFCFFVSTLFFRANIAAAAAGILWFLTYVPYFFLSNSYNDMTRSAKMGACVDFQVAMAYGSFLIGQLEGQGSGLQWSNVGSGVTVDDTFTFGDVLLMLFLDSILYAILTWYIESVFPGEYGIPRKFYFPFQKSYWCGIQESDDVEGSSFENRMFETDNKDVKRKNFEDYPASLEAGIKIKNLKKHFNTPQGEKVAVDNVSLNLYEGEITALLGHNGAGKTTTISMLTGLFPPSSGNAVVNGYDIKTNMTGVRGSLGICPQHNVLFDTLTVEEHLWFFTTLKGVDEKAAIKKEVDDMIESLALSDKRHTQSRNLSGGMKRKLSVGNALVGNSKIVILDEPTSGMDVSARRFTWDLLQRERRGRTILLTTHFMDEADVLGDRIAIMASGKVKCYGSSLFLKKRYGVGYHMVMVKKNECNVERITQLLSKYVPTSQLESNVGLELSYILPSEYSHKFEGLFNEIEIERENLGVQSYGASVTTLEEVFIKVGEEHEMENRTHQKLFRQLSKKEGLLDNDNQKEKKRETFNVVDEHSRDVTFNKNTGFKLFRQKWWAMFIKRFIHSKRHKISLVSQLLMPCVFVVMALSVARMMPKRNEPQPRTLSLSMFQKSYATYADSGRSNFTSLKNNFSAVTPTYSGATPVVLKGNDNKTVSRYLLKQETGRIAKFNKEYHVALQFGVNEKNKVIATAWFNNEAYHTPAVSINLLSNLLMSTYVGDTSHKITSINYPLPPNTQQETQQNILNPVGFQIAFNLCFGMAFLASSFILFLVQERSTKAKHLQFVSGVDPVSYWSSAYAWDLINFLIPCCAIIILFAIFQEDAFYGERLGYVLLLLLLYGWAIIPLMYIFSFAFSVPPTAYTRMTILNVVTGLAAILVVFILGIPSLGALDVRDAFKWVFLFLPNYNLGQGMIDLSTNYLFISSFSKDKIVARCTLFGYPIFRKISDNFTRTEVENLCKLTLRTYDDRSHINVQQCGQDIASFPVIDIPSSFAEQFCTLVQSFLDKATKEIQWNYLAWDTPGIGRYCIFLALEGLVFFAIVLVMEYNNVTCSCSCNCTCCHESYHVAPEDSNKRMGVDSDVLNEQKRILEEPTQNDVLTIKDITKVFSVQGRPLVAVDHLSLGIPHGECFGLLGQNGAGKTTTFRILTGDETMSSGSAYIDSYDVTRNLNQVRQRMGYCPQFDALIDLMTGRELLWMYCRLRGVPEQHINGIVEKLARDLSVFEHIDKFSKTYSGGNKRKLSTAIALCGDPPLIFLDEPSSGMDPVAQRMMWNSLSQVIASGKSIVLTSHSMEECEALCTRVAIMVNGQFKCLGSPQHLKNKFGEGYTLIAKVGLNVNTTPLKDFIENTFEGSVLKDEHQGYMHYQLIAPDKTWANLFGIMEEAKQVYMIEDYSISQTTLEQVFLNFTRAQRAAEDN